MSLRSLIQARRQEYRLLLYVGAVLAVGGWLLVVNVPSLDPVRTVRELALLFGIYALASLFLSARLPTADQILLPVVALLTAIGLLSIRRLSTTALYAASADRQIIWLAAGIGVWMATITLMPRLAT